jgi:hypothetical protein
VNTQTGDGHDMDRYAADLAALAATCTHGAVIWAGIARIGVSGA